MEYFQYKSDCGWHIEAWSIDRGRWYQYPDEALFRTYNESETHRKCLERALKGMYDCQCKPLATLGDGSEIAGGRIPLILQTEYAVYRAVVRRHAIGRCSAQEYATARRIWFAILEDRDDYVQHWQVTEARQRAVRAIVFS